MAFAWSPEGNYGFHRCCTEEDVLAFEEGLNLKLKHEALTVEFYARVFLVLELLLSQTSQVYCEHQMRTRVQV